MYRKMIPSETMVVTVDVIYMYTEAKDVGYQEQKSSDVGRNERQESIADGVRWTTHDQVYLWFDL
jgi:hypothetical protein